MRLKRLELFGFKSFADRTVFEFGEDTLTGVVGPNGCGKSNVVDGMRWVLGEQRAKSMRGDEMADVIFKGSSSRPPLSVAEVTMILENSAREDGSLVLPERGPEVSITRRVFKSGEGEYLLDGEKVRLKDIREMLYDTGLGSRGYSVLEQGKIDAVLSADPRERRRIFEEAAGISRYRQRKHETDLRVKRMIADLERLDDLLGELRSRERSLKIQAGKAERWVAARDEWTTEKSRLYSHKLRDVDTRLGDFGASLQTAETRVAELRAAREELEQGFAEREKERETIAAELERQVAEAGRLASEGRALDERRASLASRASSLEAQAAEEAGRARKLSEALAARTAELDELRAAHEVLMADVERLRADAQERARARKEKDAEYKRLRQEAQERSETVLGLLQRRTELKNRVRHHEESRDPLVARLERVRTRAEESRTARRTLAADEVRHDEALRAAQLRLEEGDAFRRELEGESQTLSARLEECSDRERELVLERARLSSRIETLSDREAELADVGEGARALLERDARGEGPFGPDELAGLLADHLRVDTRYARALDAVLGERSRALFVSGPQVARRAAEWLRRDESGVVGLISAGGLADLDARGRCAEPYGLRYDARVTGQLVDFVTTGAEQRGLARNLCGDVWLAADLEAALSLIKDWPALRFVTEDGELVDAAGLVAGRRSLTAGAVGRRAVAHDLERELVEIAQRLSEVLAERDGLRGRADELEENRRAALQELELRRHVLSEARTMAQTAQARRRDLDEALQLAEREEREATQQVERLDADLERLRGESTEADAEFQRENEALSVLEAERKEFEAVREALAREDGRAEIELARVEEQLQGATRRIGDLERADAEARGELERAERLAREHGEAAEKCQVEAEELGERSATLQESRGALDEKLRELRAVAAAAQAAIEGARRRADEVTRELESAGEALNEVKLAGQRLQMAHEELSARIVEELEAEPAALLEGSEHDETLADPVALKELEERVAELKRALERMGPVNMEALGELEEVTERLTFMDTQRDDLTKAKRALDETLRTIDKESRRLFLEAFEEVSANFRVIFRQLFGGGKADVLLAEGEDVLEAGVEIVARPPGREMLSIGLLSGGQRTMTALALLFAVFQARPSPFCVLDEVDAALDDANIQRFLAMLEGFRSSTQFVVVTHNKGTMADCERLYGITMETKGVSRHVRVELEQVDEFVPEAQGRAEDPERKRAREMAREQAHYEELESLAEKRGDEARRARRGTNGAPDPEAPDSDALVEHELDTESGEPVKVLQPAMLGATPRDDEPDDAEALLASSADGTVDDVDDEEQEALEEAAGLPGERGSA